MTASEETQAAHFRSLEYMFHSAPINTECGYRLSVAERRARVEWEVQPRFFHAGNSLHGSVYFKMLDDAAYFAAMSVVRDVFLYTVSFHIHLLRPVTGGQLRAEGELVQPSPTIFTASAVLFDGDGREMGRGSGTFSKSRIALSPEIGYRL